MSEESPHRGWRPDCVLGSWLYLRVLGVVYLAAFLSLWVQIDGLVGHNGIQPAEGYLGYVAEQVGSRGYWLLPTLGWLSASDAALHWYCGIGTALSVLLLLNVAPAIAALGLWALYLSLQILGQVFLGFQWDILLLEAGALAVFFAPWKLWPRLASQPRPSTAMLCLQWWLLFRLMFASGAVKLLSGDDTWRSLNALSVHYETQPLPTLLGWYAHQFPFWFQRLSVGVMFVIELGLPFFILLGRWGRLVAFAGFCALQVLIASTGNYCFFNLLTIGLCLPLLDDGLVARFLGADRLKGTLDSERQFEPRAKRLLVPVFATLIALLSTVAFGAQMFGRGWIPDPLLFLRSVTSPLQLTNTYGLFAVMTTKRQEISVEGTMDGTEWKEYRFRWKPGDPNEPPRLVAPHQPRLDWQMWFAALSTCQEEEWFVRFLIQLLHGSPEVTGLLASDPFAGAKPKAVRARLYEYHFTDFETRRTTGAWWRRELKGPYCPELKLNEVEP